MNRQLSAGVSLVHLMGSELDTLKLVSSLTLFEAAAGKVAPGEAEEATVELQKLCEVVLARAEEQGFPRCRITLIGLGA